MELVRKHIEEEFDRYARQYNLDDPKIRLKYEHTYRVAAFCEQIAGSLQLSAEDRDLAWTLGMFHDIGRFEQVRRYHTFKDRDSVNHAALSADLLFVDGMAEKFVEASREELALMEKAVRLHNVYLLPDNLSARERMFCNILRDADKIDILRVNCETPREEIYDLPTEAFTQSEMTNEVYESMIHRQMVNRKYSKTGIDFIMGHIAFVYGLVYAESRKLVREQGYLDKLLAFESQNPQTRERLAKIREIVRETLSQKEKAEEQIILRRAVLEDAPVIADNMRKVYEEMSNKELFVCDDLDYVCKHIDEEGFCVAACTEEGTVVGELIVHYPGEGAENLGRDVNLSQDELKKVCHMESASVLPGYRGQGLQRRMLLYAEQCIAQTGYTILLATVSPYNPASYQSLEKIGYEVLATKKKYGGLLRRIYGKRLPEH